MRMKLMALFVAVVAGMLVVAGCTPQQVKMVARQAGLASIVTWISVDNPTVDQKAVARQVVSVIKSNATTVAQGGSYYAVLSPVVAAYIDKSVPAQSKLLATLASGWVLTGVDTFFAMNPKYAADAGQALEIVDAFCDGASLGLTLAKDDPIVKAAMQGAASSAKARRSIQ